MYIFFYFFITVVLTQETFCANPNSSTETFRQLNLFSEVFRKIRTFYVDTREDQVLIEEAIRGMCTALDPHSQYLSKRAYQDLQTSVDGALYGIGVELTVDHGILKILSPLDDSPANKVGLLSGDTILEIDGEPTANFSLENASTKLKGKPGDGVRLKVEREGLQPFEITVIREKIKLKPISWKILEEIPYIRISTFHNTQIAALLKEIILEIQKSQGNKFPGIILDLRQNSGGLFDEAISVTNLFLDQKEIIEIRGRNKEKLKCFTSGIGDILKGKPMVILVDHGTASSSEIVAGALKVNNRAILVGIKTFGKGAVQTVFPLEFGEGAIRLTTGLYQLPNQEIIEGHGILPNILVPISKKTKYKPIFLEKKIKSTQEILKLDKLLEKAIQILKTEINRIPSSLRKQGSKK